MKQHLFVGGLVAAGFDPAGRFLLTVSHAGRGIFSIGNWVRVARDSSRVYPENGQIMGIGPLEGMLIPVVEHYDEPPFCFESPDGTYAFEYEDGTITVTDGRA